MTSAHAGPILNTDNNEVDPTAYPNGAPWIWTDMAAAPRNLPPQYYVQQPIAAPQQQQQVIYVQQPQPPLHQPPPLHQQPQTQMYQQTYVGQQQQHHSQPQPQQPMYSGTTYPQPDPARWDTPYSGHLPVAAQAQAADKNASPPRACVRCKRLKVRCENVGGTRPCKRCRNAGTECVTAQRKQRPRKGEHRVSDAKRPEPAEPETTPDSSDENSGEYDDDDVRGSDGSHEDGVLAPFEWIRNDVLEKKPTPPASQQQPANERSPGAPSPGGASNRSANGGTAKEKKPGISRSYFIDAKSEPTAAKDVKLEVLSVITASEVDQLFKLFMDRINPYMSMFDEKLHTVQTLKVRAPFLLTVMVTIASRFYTARPDAYLRLIEIAKRMGGDAIMNMAKSIEHCQAFILLASYPPPDRKYSENRNWLYSGVAFRMATDLSLYRPQTLPAPNEQAEREALNKTRTWIVCFYLDESMSAHFGRPATIARDDAVVRSAKDWWRRSQYAHPHDIHLCQFVELLRMFRRYLDRQGEEGVEVDYHAISSDFDDEVAKLEKEVHQLFAEHSDRSDPVCQLREMLCDFTTQYSRLVVHSVAFQKGPQDGPVHEDILARCLQAAFRVLEIVMRDIAQTGTLRYAVDGYFWYCSFASAFLLKFLAPDNSSAVDASTREKIVSYVHELIGVLGSRDVAVDGSHPPKLFSKFLSGMLARHTKHLQQQQQVSPTDLSPRTEQQPPTPGDLAPSTAVTMHQPEWDYAGFEQYDSAGSGSVGLGGGLGFADGIGLGYGQDELMKDVTPQELNTGMFILDHPPWWHDPALGMDLASLAMGSGSGDPIQHQQQFSTGAFDNYQMQ